MTFKNEDRLSISKNIKRLIKTIFIGIICVFVSTLGLNFALNTIVPDSYKTEITNKINTQFNGSINLGNISWSITPMSLILKVENTLLRDLKNNQLARWEKSRIKIKIWPLILNRIIIKSIELDQLQILVDFDAEPKSWHNFFNTKAKTEAAQDYRKTRVLFDIEEFSINDAEIKLTFKERAATFFNVNIELNTVSPKQTTSISFKSDFSAQMPNGSKILSQVFMNTSFYLKEDNIYHVDEFNIKSIFSTITEDITEENFDITLTANSKGIYNLEQDSLQFDSVKISMLNSHIVGTLDGTHLLSSPHIILTLPLQKPSLKQTYYQFSTQSPSNNYIARLIGSLEIGGSVIITPNVMGLLLDDFNIDLHKGNLELTHKFDQNHTSVDFTLSYLDVRPMISTTQSIRIKGNQSTKNIQQLIQDTPIPSEFIKKLSIDANIKFSKLITPIININDLNFYIEAKDGVVSIKPAYFSSFNGVIQAEARLDLNKMPPKMTLLQTSEKLDLNKVLNNINKMPWMVGYFNNKLNITSNGVTISELITNAEGNLDFIMKSGAIPKINLYEIAYQNIEQLNGILEADEQNSFQEDITTSLSGTTLFNFFTEFKITPEIIEANNIYLELNNQPVKANIAYIRTSEILEFTTELKLKSSNSKLNKLTWPLNCHSKQWHLPACSFIIDDIRSRINNIKHK